MAEKINFYNEDCEFVLKGKIVMRNKLKQLTEKESVKLGYLSLIFCSDRKILEINKNYLKHDYFTDIITFDYREAEKVQGDLFISVETVAENARKYGVTFEQEMTRVIIHGVLHIVGYDDKTPEEQLVMRQKEDLYINL